MRRPLLVLVLSLSVATAGCSSFFGIHDPNPAPKPTTLSGELAPGLSAAGITDRDELTRTHARILREKSYSFHQRVVERGDDGSVRGRLNLTTRVGKTGGRFVHHADRDGSLVPGERDSFEYRAWSNASLTVFAQTMSGNTRYELGSDDDASNHAQGPTNRDRLYVLLTALNVTTVERIEMSGNQTPRYKLVANDLVQPVVLTGPNGFDSVKNASFVAVVDAWGLVHRYRLEVTGTVDGNRVHRTERIEITDIGETRVKRPPWVSTALANTSRSNTQS